MNLIVFDIDGTMTLSENHHQTSFIEALNDLGILEVNTDWESYTHLTDTHIFKVNYLNQFGEEPDEDTLQLLEELVIDTIQEFEPPLELPGASRLINDLKKHPNYCFAYATGSLFRPAKFKLREANIYHEDEILLGSNGLDTREEIVKAAIDAAQSYYKIPKFEKILSAGDGVWDLQTAQNLNLGFLGIGLENKEAFMQKKVPFYSENWETVDIPYFDHLFEQLPTV